MRELIYAIVSVLLLAGTQLLFKQAIRTHEVPENAGVVKKILGLLFQPLILLGLCANVLGAACWLVALSRHDLSFLFPLLSLNYLLVPLGAALCFKERVGPRRKLGIALVCVGVIISSLGGV